MISFPETLVRLVAALVLGSLVGLERERTERGAGLRTHALVALGAALIMLVSAYGFAGVTNGKTVVLDPSRIAAQIVSGIGFLGAGTILLRREVVKGLTTAAAIWLVAGLGMACGIGLYREALAATVLALVVLAGLRPLERRLFPHRRSQLLRVRAGSSLALAPLIAQIRDICARHGVGVQSYQVQLGRGEGVVAVRCETDSPEALAEVAGAVRALPGVSEVEGNLPGSPTAPGA